MMIEAIAAFSAVVGFGLAFFIERKLSRRTQKKSQRVLTFSAMTSFGVGLTGILIEVIAFAMLDLPLRFSHVGEKLIFHMLLFPAILLGIAKLIGIKKGPSSANAGTLPKSPFVPQVAPAGATSPISVSEQDENHWALALEEFESDKRRPGLWAKAFAEANGNEGVAKAAYLRLRSVELAQLTPESSEGTTATSSPPDAVQECTAFGLSADEIEYLGQPLKAISYLQKYGVTEEILSKAIGTGKIRGVRCDGVLWVQDQTILHRENVRLWVVFVGIPFVVVFVPIMIIVLIPGVHELIQRAVAPTSILTPGAPSMPRIELNRKSCIFMWDDTSREFKRLDVSPTDKNEYATTSFSRPGKEAYTQELFRQLEKADSQNNETLAQSIANEIHENLIYVYYPRKLSAEFIRGLFVHKGVSSQCH